MKLKVDATGFINRVVISTLPRKFIARIFKHCMGKNNTPYIANNCFKGVLYFDEELAARFAQKVGYQWKGWQNEDDLYHKVAFRYGTELELAVSVDGGAPEHISGSELETKISLVDLDDLVARVGEDEALIFMGSVDKGKARFTVDAQGGFDRDKLVLLVDSFDEFQFCDRMVTGLTYDGAEMHREILESVGKNMLDPIMFSPDKQELDLDSFRVLSEGDWQFPEA